MRTKWFNQIVAGAAICVLVACNNRDPEDPMLNQSEEPANALNEPARRDTVFVREREVYRSRLTKRMERLNDEIEAARRERTDEKDINKKRDHETRIARRERTRQDLRERMDRLEAQTEAGWENFKKDLDDLFNTNDRELEKERTPGRPAN
jgi:hypothetical protein